MHHACIRAHCRCPCCRRARASPRRQSRPSRSRRGALRSSAASASRRGRPTAAPSAAAQPTAAASAVSPHCRVCVATAVLVGVPCMLRQPNQSSWSTLCCRPLLLILRSFMRSSRTHPAINCAITPTLHPCKNPARRDRGVALPQGALQGADAPQRGRNGGGGEGTAARGARRSARRWARR